MKNRKLFLYAYYIAWIALVYAWLLTSPNSHGLTSKLHESVHRLASDAIQDGKTPRQIGFLLRSRNINPADIDPTLGDVNFLAKIRRIASHPFIYKQWHWYLVSIPISAWLGTWLGILFMFPFIVARRINTWCWRN